MSTGEAYAAVVADLERQIAEIDARRAQIEATLATLRTMMPAARAAEPVRALPAPAAKAVVVAAPAPALPVAAPVATRARKFSDEQLRAAMAEGLSDGQMAVRFGCSPAAIYLRRRRLGLKPGDVVAVEPEPAPEPRAEAVEARSPEFDAALEAALPGLRRYALSLTRANAAEAADLLQDATVQAMRSWHTFEPGTNFRAWMNTIMRNTFLSGIRNRAARGGAPQALEDVVVPVSGGQEAAVELGEALDVLAEMPEGQRDAVIGAALGRTLEETAEEAGVPIGTIKSRTARGRETLARAGDGAEDQEAIDRFIREKGVTKCPPSNAMRGAQLAKAGEEMRGRKRAPW